MTLRSLTEFATPREWFMGAAFVGGSIVFMRIVAWLLVTFGG